MIANSSSDADVIQTEKLAASPNLLILKFFVSAELLASIASQTSHTQVLCCSGYLESADASNDLQLEYKPVAFKAA